MGFNYQIFLQLTVFGLVAGGLYALVASGFSLIYGVMKILNIAYGEFITISAYIMFWLFTLAGINPLISILITTPSMFGMGLLIYKLIVAPLQKRGSGHLLEGSSLIAFFGALIVLQNMCLVLWSADYRVVTYLNTPFRFLFFSISVNRLVVMGISILIIVFLEFFLTSTYFGKAIRAITQDRDASKRLGPYQ